jgi:hypothetical protein
MLLRSGIPAEATAVDTSFGTGLHTLPWVIFAEKL